LAEGFFYGLLGFLPGEREGFFLPEVGSVVVEALDEAFWGDGPHFAGADFVDALIGGEGCGDEAEVQVEGDGQRLWDEVWQPGLEDLQLGGKVDAFGPLRYIEGLDARRVSDQEALL